MASILKMTFADLFLLWKLFLFWLLFHWRLFPRVQSAIGQHWFRYWIDTKHATCLLFKSMMSSFIDTYMFHSASMSLTGPGTRAHLPLKLQSAGQCYLVMNTLTSSVLWQGMDFMLPQASVFWLEYILEAYITKYFKVRLYNSMNISLHSYSKPNKVIDAKFCNGPNSCADVACA